MYKIKANATLDKLIKLERFELLHDWINLISQHFDMFNDVLSDRHR